MGVAVMTSTCGDSPLRKSRARCATPKRCCSSTTTRPSRRNFTGFSIRACVPTSRSSSPEARASRRARRGAAAGAACQESQANSGSFQPGSETRRVLLGQDLRGRHESALHAVLRGQEKSEAGHDRLPAADVALEQAGHRPSGGEVGRDLTQRALLGSRQPEGQRLLRRLAHRPVGGEDDPGALPQAGALLLDRGREHEELLPREEEARGLRFPRARREVRSVQGAQEPVRREARRLERRRDPVQRRPREDAPGPRRDPRDAVVDPDDSPGVEGIGLFARVEELRFRVLQAQRSARRPDRSPVEHERLSRLSRLDKRGIPVVPDNAHRPGAVVGDPLDAKASPPHPGRSDAAKAHQERGRPPLRERGDAAVLPPVLIPEGKREEEVSDRSDSLLGEPRGPRRPETGNPRDGIARRQRRPPPSGQGGGRFLYADGFQNVRVTLPSFRTSPWWIAAGTPVASRVSFTNVPWAAPSSSIT